MAKKVTANGKVFTFGDDVSTEQIASAIDEYFATSEKKSPDLSAPASGGQPLPTGFGAFQTPVATEAPAVLTPKGQSEFTAQKAQKQAELQSALGAYQGEPTIPAAVPQAELRPEQPRTGNYAKYLYNEVLKGTGSLANAVTDAAFAAGAFLPTNDPYVESGNLLKDYRKNNASKVRSFLKDQIGAEVDKGLERKYQEGLVTGAIGGLASSLPAMAGAAATGGGSLFAQMYDAGLQSIEAQPGAEKLDEDTKTIYAGTLGLITSRLEKYGLDRVLKGSGLSNAVFNKILSSAQGKKISGEALDNLIDESVKGVAKMFAKGGVRAVDAFATEFSTGAAQEFVTDVSERLLDKATGEPIFDTSNKESWEGFLNRIVRAGTQEGIGGGVLGAGIGMLTANSKKAVQENQAVINEIDRRLQDPEIAPQLEEVLLQRKADTQAKIDDIVDEEAELQSKMDADAVLEAQALTKEADKIDIALQDPALTEAIKTDLEAQKETIEKQVSEVIKRKPKKEVENAVSQQKSDEISVQPAPAVSGEMAQGTSGTEPQRVTGESQTVQEGKEEPIKVRKMAFEPSKTEEDKPTDFTPFEQIVKESKTFDEAFSKIQDIKGIDRETSKAFRTKYDPEDNLSAKQAFEKFYNEVKSTEPAPTPKPTKVSGTSIPSPKGLEQFSFASTQLPNGKYAVYETKFGKPISNQYNTEEELLEAFEKNKDKLTVEVVSEKVGMPVAKETTVKIIEPDFDKEGDLTDAGMEKATTILINTAKEVAAKYKIPEKPLLKYYNISSKGGYVSGIEGILDVSESINYKRFIKTFKEIAFEMFPDKIDDINEQINVHSQELLDAIENDDTEFKVRSDIGRVFTAIQEINSKFNSEKPTATERRLKPSAAPVTDVSPLQKAETDLILLKRSTDKPKKYEASIRRLIDAKNAKEITEQEFNTLKKSFDDVMAESSGKAGDALRKLADTIDKGKIGKPGSFRASTGFDAVWDGSLTVVSTSLRAGAKVADAIEAGIDYVKKSDWYKSLIKADQDRFDSEYRSHMEGEMANYVKQEEPAVEVEEPVQQEAQEQLEKDANVMGITKKELALLDPYTPTRTKNSRQKAREKADRMLEEGTVNIKDLIKKLQNPNYRPEVTELDLVRSYFMSLTERINKKPTPELIAERQELLQTIREAGFRLGQTVQAFDGLVALEDNLASFLTEESQYADLTSQEVTDLTEKYNAAMEALAKLKAKEEEARAKELNKKAEAKVKSVPRAKVKGDFQRERAKIKEDMRAALRRARGLTQSTFVPYANELIAIAPYVRKMMVSYVNEGVYELKDIIKRIHGELVDEIPDITENDVRDIIAGQYPNPKNTKNAKLAEIKDLEMQAKLERKIELLEAGILETKSQVGKRKKSDIINDLEKQVKEIKKRHPELTYPSRLQGRMTFYTNRIKELKDQIAKGEFDPVEPPIPVLLDEEALRLKDTYAKFRQETMERRRKKEFEALSKWQQTLRKAKGIADLRRAVQVSIDLSIPLRQGVSVMLNPRTAKLGVKGYGEMISTVISRKNYDRMMVDLERSPGYLESKDDGIVYNEASSLSSTDEWHQNNPIIDRIPVLRRLVKGSEVAAAAWTNYARFELYKRGTQMLLAEGKTRENSKKAYEQMAARVMVDTGRGKLPFLEDKNPSKTDTRIKQLLSNTFFGPRLYAAIFRKLDPTYYFNPKVDPTVRVEALKDMMGYVASQVALGLLLTAAGATVSLDPDDPDFLKARWGKKVVDLTAGQSVYIRTFFRVMRAVIWQADPDVSHEDAVKAANFAKKSIENFWRNKLAPNTAYMVNAVMGENTLGEKFDPWEILKIYPMYAGDLFKAMKEANPLDAALILPIGVLGLGYQEYSRDTRRARVSSYVKDPAVKEFLKKNKLKITGDINQEVYDLKVGGLVKMDKEQSDKYEKIWSEAVAQGVKEDMKELQKLADEDKANEDVKGYTKKLPAAIGRIKAEATIKAKWKMTGVTPQMLKIEDKDKTYELSPEMVRKRAEFIKKFMEENESLRINKREQFLLEGKTEQEADELAEEALFKEGVSQSRKILLPELRNENN